jgi:hypothetical protein
MPASFPLTPFLLKLEQLQLLLTAGRGNRSADSDNTMRLSKKKKRIGTKCLQVAEIENLLKIKYIKFV